MSEAGKHAVGRSLSQTGVSDSLASWLAIGWLTLAVCIMALGSKLATRVRVLLSTFVCI